MHPILDHTYTLAETARLSGLSTAALYKSITRNSISLASKAGGQFAFSFDGVLAVAVYADLLRAGVHSSVADQVARRVAEDELGGHLLVRRRVEVWSVVTHGATETVDLAYGYEGLRDVLRAANSNTTTLVRLHTLAADVAEAIEALREGAR